jgi:hypothetical protein
MIAALFGVGVVTGGGDEEGEPPPEPEAAAEIDRVAARLERIRKLEFERIPPVRTISSEDARREGLAALDRDYPPRRRADDERVLALLGLLPRDADLRELAGTIFGEEVAGFYDDRTERMTLVAGGGAGTEGEITLAHELTHALEDQHFGLEPGEGLDDERTARTALFEGTATVAMVDYAARHLTRGALARRELIDQLAVVDLLESSSGLPPYMQRSLTFPYTQGARFVDAIGTWGPANRALRGRGPVSTEQILHPARYLSGERPRAVRAGPAPGAGWRRASRGTVGEFDTRELIRTSDSAVRAARAAEGWGGGRYTLWRRGEQAALVLRWRWDTRRDAAEFVSALPHYVERGLDGRGAGPGVWRSRGRGFVAAAPGDVVRLAIAPTRRLALRLAR